MIKDIISAKAKINLLLSKSAMVDSILIALDILNKKKHQIIKNKN